MVENAEVKDINQVQALLSEVKKLKHCTETKLFRLLERKKAESVRTTLQQHFLSVDVPGPMNGIFRNIKVQSPYSFRIGFSAKIIKQTLNEVQIFDDNVNDDISHFAESEVVVENRTFSDSRLSFTLIKWSDEEKRKILNAFPIFGMIPYLKKYMAPGMKCRDNMPSPEDWFWEGWSDDAIWDQLQTTWNPREKWKWLEFPFYIHPKEKLQLYNQYGNRRFVNDGKHEQELKVEWESFKAMVDSISKEQWIEISGLMEHGRSAPGGKDSHAYLVEKLDPENEFFRRKKNRKRKRDSDN